ncbi:hypothetical protein [Sinorhizobium fredii]|uniref:hypothetical protein n=1 Tax=Rhizobium fredii TaxID=380 RepID=UPI0012FDFB8A|nr:hypothetical protein [Sinorhizobium fredii]
MINPERRGRVDHAENELTRHTHYAVVKFDESEEDMEEALNNLVFQRSGPRSRNQGPPSQSRRLTVYVSLARFARHTVTPAITKSVIAVGTFTVTAVAVAVAVAIAVAIAIAIAGAVTIAGAAVVALIVSFRDIYCEWSRSYSQ